MSGLRLIVGFEVRDADFLTHQRGSAGCPDNHPSGFGPYCSECGQRFVETPGSVSLTGGAVALARKLHRDTAVDPTRWQTWAQDASRDQGSIVVGYSGDSTVLGLLVGHYKAGCPMSWPTELLAELTIKCDVLQAKLLSHTDRPINVMLIE